MSSITDINEIITNLSNAYNVCFELGDYYFVSIFNEITINIEFNNKINNSTVYKKGNSNIESDIMSKLLKTVKFSNVIDCLEFIIENTVNIKNYCISCATSLSYKPDIFASCGSDKCKYKLEDVLLDNDVYEFISGNKIGANLLIRLTRDAMTKPDVFDPFPPYFLKNEFEIKRGHVAKIDMTVGDYNKYTSVKDFERIKNVLKNDFEFIFNNIIETPNDNMIRHKYGNDVYYFLRFIFKSCTYDIRIDKTIGDVKIYKFTSNFVDENNFKESVKLSGKTGHLFHGSKNECWHSIMRNGLKSMSNTTLMTTGAAFGSGIYMSDSYSTSYGYTGYAGAKSCPIVAVYEIADDVEKYKKSSNIYVIPDPKKCILRYLIIGNPPSKSHEMISGYFRSHSEEKIIEKSRMSEKGKKRLMNELVIIKKNNVYNVELVNNDVSNWIVGYDRVKLHIKFPDTYPFQPPFVYLKSPVFVDLPKYITDKGALCIEYLTPSNWLPVISIENLVIQIYTLIVSPALDNKHMDEEYEYESAKLSYDTLAVGNGWN